MPKYVESEWSFAQVHGLEPQTICAFGQNPGTLIIVGADGSYLMTSFAEGGECEKMSFARFVRPPQEELAPASLLPPAGSAGAAAEAAPTAPAAEVFHSVVSDGK